MFADDLNVFQLFDRLAPPEECCEILSECRRNVHAWGRKNRVSFDASKEHLVILHPSESHGEPFRLLGCMIDLDLRMNTCVEQLLGNIRPKTVAILRTRAYYDVPALLNQYKTHIWGLVEIHSCAYFHAATSLLQKVAEVQQFFCTSWEYVRMMLF